MEHFIFLILLLCLHENGVSGVGKDDVSVSRGDSVTLHTGVKTNQQYRIVWFYEGIRIAVISGDLSYICTDVQCNYGTERFRGRLKLDHQTGCLTIMYSTFQDEGEYEVEISSTSGRVSVKTFTVSVIPRVICTLGLPFAGVAVIAAAVLLLVVAIAGVICCCCKCKSKKKKIQMKNLLMH